MIGENDLPKETEGDSSPETYKDPSEEGMLPEEEVPSEEEVSPEEEVPPEEDFSPEEDPGKLSTQQLLALEEHKKNIVRLAAIGLVIFGAAFYFVWDVYLNFGTIRIEGQAPFSVKVFGETEVGCTSSPCEVKVKKGDKAIGFSKTGYNADNINIEVPLWDSVTVRPFFALVPYLKEVKEIPKNKVTTSLQAYSIKYDASHNNYALVKNSDDFNSAISYFGGAVQNPAIYGSPKAVVVLERDQTLQKNAAYYFDVISKERTTLNGISFVPIRASSSPDGKYFLIEGKDADGKLNLYLANSNAITQIKVDALFNNAFWNLRNNLIIVYQGKETESQYWFFSEINSHTSEETQLLRADQFTGALSPKEISVNPANNSIFFKSGDKIYEIIN